MQFTDGGHRASESLMQDRLGSDHYDSGVGILETTAPGNSWMVVSPFP